MSQTLHKYDPERLCAYLQHHVAEFSGLAEIVMEIQTSQRR